MGWAKVRYRLFGQEPSFMWRDLSSLTDQQLEEGASWLWSLRQPRGDGPDGLTRAQLEDWRRRGVGTPAEQRQVQATLARLEARESAYKIRENELRAELGRRQG